LNAQEWAKAKALIAEALLQPIGRRAGFVCDECTDPVLRLEVLSLLRHNPDADLSCPDDDRTVARRIFCDVVDVPEALRAATLDRECVNRPSLRRVVKAMLDSTVIGQAGEPTRLPFVSIAPVAIDKYRLVREIGNGGMGTVYEAVQAQPQRRVALKLIRGDRISPEFMHRFAVEIQALGRLRHAGIARIYDGGTFDGTTGSQPYFVMELVEGLPLDEYVATRRLGLRAVLQLLISVSEAVHHAHLQDVIHRDLKPANILVDETGQPKVLDFGVARIIGAESRSATADAHTQPGVVVGTLPYMSPEQFEADPDHFDQRSDVYALGVIAYKILAGRLPYKFAGGLIDARRVVHDVPAPCLGDVDRRLLGDPEAVILKALAKERAGRYQTAHAFATDLSRVLLGQPISIVPSTWGRTIRRWAMRAENIRQIGWAGVIGFSILSLFFFTYVFGGLISRFRPLPVLPRGIDYVSFMVNLLTWAIALAALSRVNWHVARGQLAWMWAAFIAAAILTAFTTSVLFGLVAYRFGGALDDPVLRVALYMMYTPLAWLYMILMALALFTAYRLRQWDRPVVGATER